MLNEKFSEAVLNSGVVERESVLENHGVTPPCEAERIGFYDQLTCTSLLHYSLEVARSVWPWPLLGIGLHVSDAYVSAAQRRPHH